MNGNGALPHDPVGAALEVVQQQAQDHQQPSGYQGWRRLTEELVAYATDELARKRQRITTLHQEIHDLETHVDLWRRALALKPQEAPAPRPPLPPPVQWEGHAPPRLGRGTHPGPGVGWRAGRYLLEVLQQREQVAPGSPQVDPVVTLRQLELACHGWATSTIHDGLRWLTQRHLVERVAAGRYQLTDAGRATGPAQDGELPLAEPSGESSRGESPKAAGEAPASAPVEALETRG